MMAGQRKVAKFEKIFVPDGFLYRLGAEKINSRLAEYGVKSLPLARISTVRNNRCPGIILCDPNSITAGLKNTIRAFPKHREGYRIRSMTVAGVDYVVIQGGGARGAFLGSVHLRDEVLKIGKDKVVLDLEAPVNERPAFEIRATYSLDFVCMFDYPLDHWKTAFDLLIENGYNLVQLWTAGCFPSKKFPLTVEWKCNYINEVIEYLHLHEVKVFLMSGVGGWLGMSPGLIRTKPEIRITWPEELYKKFAMETTRMGICMSRGKDIMLDYLEEMYRAYPEADGMALEIYCEKPHCYCPDCQSRGLWKIELDFLKELSGRIWRWKKDAEFSWMIGYGVDQGGADDKMTGHGTWPESRLFSEIRKIKDPRYIWWHIRPQDRYIDRNGKEHRFDDPETIRNISTNCIYPGTYGRMDLLLDTARKAGVRAVYGAPGVRSAYLPRHDQSLFGYFVKKTPADGVNLFDDIITRMSGYIYGQSFWRGEYDGKQVTRKIRRRFFNDEIPVSMVKEILFMYGLIKARIMLSLGKYKLYGDEAGGKALKSLKVLDDKAMGRLRKLTSIRSTLGNDLAKPTTSALKEIEQHAKSIIRYARRARLLK